MQIVPVLQKDSRKRGGEKELQRRRFSRQVLTHELMEKLLSWMEDHSVMEPVFCTAVGKQAGVPQLEGPEEENNGMEVQT